MNTKDKVNVLKKLKNKIKKKMSELRIVWNLLAIRIIIRIIKYEYQIIRIIKYEYQNQKLSDIGGEEE